ncbi:Ribosome-releasing factor 2, mitochondrial [Tilletia horrida]|nr:Ribosome-releasing factor 2, mitochondrial [Tilletia horrida]
MLRTALRRAGVGACCVETRRLGLTSRTHDGSSGRLRSLSTSPPILIASTGPSRSQQDVYEPDLIRNISIIAHIDAGKTTLTERLLLYSQHQSASSSSSDPGSADTASKPAKPATSFSAASIAQPGSVDTGTTVTDFLDAERERGITIQSAAVGPLQWTPSEPSSTSAQEKPSAIYLVDTPGHVDFTIEVERALRVVDGCVVVLDGVEGVEAQTEGVWRQAARYGIRSHIVFINKLDRAGASVSRSLLSLIQRTLHSRPLLLQLPIYSLAPGSSRSGTEDEVLTGLIDLLTLQVLSFSGDANHEVQRVALASSHPLFEHAIRARNRLIETLAEQDESLLERYLDVSEELTGEDVAQQLRAISASEHLRPALRRQTAQGTIIPVLCGAAARNFGVQPLLDAISQYLPSPAEAAAVAAQHGENAAKDGDVSFLPATHGASGGGKNLHPLHQRDLAALAFKVVWDKRRGPITFVRVYSGTLSRTSTLFNTTTQTRERLAKVFLPFADQYVETPALRAGQIGVIMGLRDTRTGDTLIDARNATSALPSSDKSSKRGTTGGGNSVTKTLRLRPIHVPPPVFSMSIEPESKSDEASVTEALSMLVRTDPSLRLDDGSSSDGGFGSAGTGQTVLSGMGELHLEIARERLANEFGVRARMGSVRVSYRETLDGDGPASAEGEGVQVEEVWEKEVGGKKLKAGCTLMVRRLNEEAGEVGDAATGGNKIVVQIDEDVDDDGQDELAQVLAEPIARGHKRAKGGRGSQASPDADGEAEVGGSDGVLDSEMMRHAFTTGLIAGLARGPLSSNPLTGLHITLSEPRLFGPDLSPPRALSMAAGAALRRAIKAAAPPAPPSESSETGSGPFGSGPARGRTGARMMEPVMKVRIECDASHMGKVVSDVTAEQAGSVVDVEQPSAEAGNLASSSDGSGSSLEDVKVYIPPHNLGPSSSSSSSSSGLSPSASRNRIIIHALVPLARLVSYSSRLRALTGGMGTFTMELHGFAQTSQEREKQILRELGKAF